MSKLRLRGATSGYTEIQASAVAGDNTITLPATTGGSLIAADSSGNVNIDSGTLYVDATNNRVGIGTTSPQLSFVCSNGGANGLEIDPTQSTGTITGINSYNRSSSTFTPLRSNASEHRWDTSSTERARIDSSGRLLVGTSSSLESNAKIQVQNGHVHLYENNNVAGAGYELQWSTNGGATGRLTAAIRGVQQTTGTSGGYLTFSTTADGASSPTERMRIVNTGDILLNKTATDDTSAGFAWRSSNYFSAVRSGGASGYINRLTNDGALLEFAQDSVTEGTISVSGTTVSYNGAHLSRWSQLPGGAERTEILRGTVLSNIDEMCAWSEEDNEQLNRMKVSDVEGDPNVAGVFQAWDDDDDTYTDDFYCAMTGDFIIRIAEGVTVERGDLLMSAGDGTAKPQGDDIVRSKTVAKVTSTHVSETYADGSYCVPCVLMAC